MTGESTHPANEQRRAPLLAAVGSADVWALCRPRPACLVLCCGVGASENRRQDVSNLLRRRYRRAASFVESWKR